jgi:hypothetical protein
MDKHLALTIQQVLDGNPINLCDSPANLCPSSLGIPRAEMPQIEGEGGVKFLRQLQQKGISITDGEIAVGDLRSAQKEINGVAIHAALGDLRHPTDEEGYVLKHPIFVSQDDYVLDGHHRWAALLIYSYITRGDDREPAPIIRIGLPIRQLVKLANSSEFTGHASFQDWHVQQ